MVERIKEIINLKSRSVRDFALTIGVKPITVNQQITGSRSISLDVTSAILNSFEDISAEWLLRGKGEMFLKPESDPTSIKEAISNREKILINTIVMQQDIINKLKEKINSPEVEIAIDNRKSRK